MSLDAANKAEFFRKLEKLLVTPAGSLEGDQRLKDLKSWDSLAILEFMMLASSEYGTEVQPADVTSAETVDDLARLVSADGVSAR